MAELLVAMICVRVDGVLKVLYSTVYCSTTSMSRRWLSEPLCY